MVEFYRALGAELVSKPVRKGGECFQGSLGSLEISIYNVEKKETPVTPNFLMRLEVEKIEPVMERVRQVENVQILMDVESLPDGKKAILLDPDGHSIELIEPWSETDQG